MARPVRATADAVAECIVLLDGVARLVEQEGQPFTPAELVGVLETACSKLGTALAQDYGHDDTYRRLRTAGDGIFAEVLLRDAGRARGVTVARKTGGADV